MEDKRASTAGGSILKFIKSSTARPPVNSPTKVTTGQTFDLIKPLAKDVSDDNEPFYTNFEKEAVDIIKENEKYATDEVEGLDPEVLASLPEDIREEVLRDYKQHMTVSSASNSSRPITRASASSSQSNSNRSSPSASTSAKPTSSASTSARSAVDKSHSAASTSPNVSPNIDSLTVVAAPSTSKSSAQSVGSSLEVGLFFFILLGIWVSLLLIIV